MNCVRQNEKDGSCDTGGSSFIFIQWGMVEGRLNITCREECVRKSKESQAFNEIENVKRKRKNE